MDYEFGEQQIEGRGHLQWMDGSCWMQARPFGLNPAGDTIVLAVAGMASDDALVGMFVRIAATTSIRHFSAPHALQDPRMEVFSPPIIIHTAPSDDVPPALEVPSLPPARPNTELLFPLTFAHSKPMPPTKLHPEAWARALAEYPDQVFAETLVSAIRHGVLLGVDPDLAPRPSSSVPPPLPSALEFPFTIDKDLEHEISLGRIVDITDTATAIQPLLSPLGSVPKKYSTKRRRIHHLSHPRGSSLNDAIPVEYGHLVYDAVLATIERIRVAGKGSFLYKADLEAAFRHIPIHPDHTHSWASNGRVEFTLTFSFRSAFGPGRGFTIISRKLTIGSCCLATKFCSLYSTISSDWLNVTPASDGIEYARHGRAIFRAGGR
ncbi:hypothetical protein DFH09DRAFT_1385201 [Mycena vulgaris]|nr:hypothetical protein DFH09DRAFT_1385201 [Mycena vulgaris]